jgi:hypothetical protein
MPDSEPRHEYLGPRRGLAAARTAIRAQRLPATLDGLLTPAFMPVTTHAWQRVLTKWRRATAPEGRFAVRYDQHTLAETLGPGRFELAALLGGFDRRLGRLTEDQIMAGEQSILLAHDRRGPLDPARRTGGKFQFVAGHDSFKTSSSRYLRGHLVDKELNVAAVPFSEATGDLRDSWLLVQGSATKDGKPLAKKIQVILAVVSGPEGRKIHVPIELTDEEYDRLNGNRLEPTSFMAIADEYRIRDRMRGVLEEAYAKGEREDAQEGRR